MKNLIEKKYLVTLVFYMAFTQVHANEPQPECGFEVSSGGGYINITRDKVVVGEGQDIYSTFGVAKSIDTYVKMVGVGLCPVISFECGVSVLRGKFALITNLGPLVIRADISDILILQEQLVKAKVCTIPENQKKEPVGSDPIDNKRFD